MLVVSTFFSCSVEPGIGDHNIVYATNHLLLRRNKPISRKYLWKKADVAGLKKDAESLQDTIKMRCSDDVNIVWKFSLESILRLQEKHVQSKMSSTRFQQPWIDGNVKRFSRKKRRWFDPVKLTQSPRDRETYDKIKKASRQISSQTYKNYLNNIPTDSDENRPNRRIWSYIKIRRCDNTGVALLKDDISRPILDSHAIANALNSQFTSVFIKDSSAAVPKIPWQHPTIKTFDNTTLGVEKLLQNLQEHKAAGPDGLSTKLLKTVASEIVILKNTTFSQMRSIDSN